MSQITSFGSGALPPGAAVTSLNGLTDAVTIGGTANQITVGANVGQNIPLSLPTTLIGPGTIASTGLLTAGNGLTVTTGTTTITPLNTAGMVVNSAAGVLSTAATTVHCVQLGTAGGQLTSLTNGTTGQVLTAVTGGDPTWAASTGGVTSITGTANQITASASTGAITLSIPSTFIAPGSVQVTSGFTVVAGTSAITGTTNINTSGSATTTIGGSSGTGNVIIGNTTGTVTLGPTGSGATFNVLFSGYQNGALFINSGGIVQSNNLTVSHGGTGAGSFTAYAVLCGGTTSTGSFQNVSGVGSATQILTSNGAGALPTWQAPAASVTSITGTANQITASASTGAVTLSTPSAFIAPGSSSSTTTMTCGTDFQITSGIFTMTDTSANNTRGIFYKAINSTAADGTYIRLMRARAATTTVVTGDTLSTISMNGYDGSSEITCSQISSVCSGTIGANRIASNLLFYTHPDSTSASTLRLSIPSTGGLLVASPDSGVGVTISGGGLTVTGTTTLDTGLTGALQATSGVVSAGTLPVGSGGTGVTATTVGGILVGSSTSAFTNLPIGSNTFVLTSNGTTAAWAAASGGVTSLTGTANQIAASASTGAITLSIPSTFIAPGSIQSTTSVTVGTNVLLPTTTSSAGQIQINSTIFLHSFAGSLNTFVGSTAGNTTAGNVGTNNTGIGSTALLGIQAGGSNSALSSRALEALTTGSNNTALGYAAGYQLVSGSSNLFVGKSAGENYTGAESSNIMIRNSGTLGESNVCRIGTGTGTSAGNLNKVFFSGIYNETVGATAGVNITDSTDQIGTISGTSTQVLIGGTKPSWGAVSLASAAVTGTLPIGNGGTGLTTATTGDMMYASGTNTWANLAIGSASQVLSVSAGIPTWVANTATGSVIWSVITADQTAAINNGYICNKGSALVLTLPGTAAVGSIIEVTGINTALGWKLAQPASVQVFFGTSSTTSGTSGFLQSSNIRDSIRIVCVVANLTWNVIYSVGNITVN